MISHARFASGLGRLAPLALLLVTWQLVAGLIGDPRLLPPPVHVLTQSLPEISRFGGASAPGYFVAFEVLGRHLAITFVRVLTGLLVGFPIGVLVGMSLHFFSAERRGSSLVLSVLRGVPLFALIPLFLYWFPNREAGAIVYIIIAVILVVATNTYEGILNVPPTYVENAILLGARRVDIFRHVYAPAVLPELRGSMRAVTGLVWAFALGAEYLSAHSGVGYLVYQSYVYADMGKLILFGVLYGVVGLLSLKAVQASLGRMIRWQDTHRAEAL